MKEEIVNYKKNVKDEEGNILEVIEGSITYAFPETIDEAVTEFGDKVVVSIFNSALAIKLQAIARAAENAEAAQAAVAAYVPGITRQSSGGMSKSSLVKAIAALDPEARKEVERILGLA